MIKKNIVAGMNAHSVHKLELIEELKKDIDNNVTKQHISITNTEAMYIASKSKEHFNYINNAIFSLCDGVGIKIVAKFHGININKYHSPDMMIDLISAGQKYGWFHYFIAGEEGAGERLKFNLTNKYPRARISDTYSPPFRNLIQKEELKMITAINAY